MQKILTIALLEGLIGRGYRYCLSRTTAILGDDADICITLIPVIEEPSLNTLPAEFDTYFDIDDEPRQMALGINETIILIDLSDVTLKGELTA